MQKGNIVSGTRIQILVKLFIEQELLLFNKKSLGYVKKYFRYLHLGNRLTRKINSTKNGVFNLISKEHDVIITIQKGSGGPVTNVEINHNELWFKKD